MRNNYVTPAFRPPVRSAELTKSIMVAKLKRICQRSERRFTQRIAQNYASVR